MSAPLRGVLPHSWFAGSPRTMGTEREGDRADFVVVAGCAGDEEADEGGVGVWVGGDVDDVEVAPGDVVVVAHVGGEAGPVGGGEGWWGRILCVVEDGDEAGVVTDGWE